MLIFSAPYRRTLKNKEKSFATINTKSFLSVVIVLLVIIALPTKSEDENARTRNETTSRPYGRDLFPSHVILCDDMRTFLPCTNQYNNRLTPPNTAQTRYISLYPRIGIRNPSIMGPIPEPRSTMAENVEVVTPYLWTGLIEMTDA